MSSSNTGSCIDDFSIHDDSAKDDGSNFDTNVKNKIEVQNYIVMILKICKKLSKKGTLSLWSMTSNDIMAR
jgi:hypothetical protein